MSTSVTDPVVLPRLLLLTDRSQLSLGRGLVRTVAECVDAGLTHVVVRELDEPPDARAALVAALVDVGATVIAAHTPLPGAIGVHLPVAATGGNTLFARVPARCSGLLPEATACYPRLVGRSCHTRAEVGAAAEQGAAYATLSPYAASDSKPGYGPPLVAGDLADHPIPVYALGGITPGNAASALAAGAHGVAVMGAVMRAEEPAAVVRDLLTVLRVEETP